MALYEREYDRWNEELMSILEENESLSKAGLADRIAISISNREQLLKLLAMNNYDMEANSRPELLASFKVAYGISMQNICRLLQKFCPDMTVSEIQSFIYIFFPFMFGIYSYTAMKGKQRAAMEKANVNYVYQFVYEITHICLCTLLDPQCLGCTKVDGGTGEVL